jgi:hypothetical protein
MPETLIVMDSLLSLATGLSQALATVEELQLSGTPAPQSESARIASLLQELEVHRAALAVAHSQLKRARSPLKKASSKRLRQQLDKRDKRKAKHAGLKPSSNSERLEVIGTLVRGPRP